MSQPQLLPTLTPYKGQSIFTVFPQAVDRILMIRERKNRESIQAYLALARAFEAGSGQHLNAAREIVARLDPYKKLNPSLHAIVHRASIAMKGGDALGCYRALKWVETAALLVEEQELQIKSPDSSPACFEAIDHMHNDETKDVHGRRAEIYETSGEDISPYVQHIREVMNLIEVVDPVMHAEINAVLSEVVVFRAQALMGGSLARSFGAVYIGSPDHDPIREKFGQHFSIRGVPYFMEHVVHESSHNVLFGLMLFDPMVLNSSQDRYSAPLRKDLRPIYGIFHASFVLARMIRVFRLMHAQGDPVYLKLINHFVPRLENGLNVIKAHGNLTPVGWEMFETFRECAQV